MLSLGRGGRLRFQCVRICWRLDLQGLFYGLDEIKILLLCVQLPLFAILHERAGYVLRCRPAFEGFTVRDGIHANKKSVKVIFFRPAHFWKQAGKLCVKVSVCCAVYFVHFVRPFLISGAYTHIISAVRPFSGVLSLSGCLWFGRPGHPLFFFLPGLPAALPGHNAGSADPASHKVGLHRSRLGSLC